MPKLQYWGKECTFWQQTKQPVPSSSDDGEDDDDEKVEGLAKMVMVMMISRWRGLP